MIELTYIYIFILIYKQYNIYCLTGNKSKMFSITPMCMNAQTHAQALLFQTAATSLWNGTSIISFYFCLLFKGRILTSCETTGLWNTGQKEEGGAGEEWGSKASADHTIRTTQTLSSLKCHSCDQPFHLRGAQQHFCHTRSFEAQTFQPIRTFNSDNLYASVIFPTSPAPRTAAAEGFHFCSLHDMPRALGPNWKTAYGKARRKGRAKNWKELLESH